MACRYDQPIDNRQALKGVLQKFITFLHAKDNQNVKSMPTVRCNSTNEKLSNISTSNSVYSYINYRKSVDNKLVEINNNISEMLIESFKGIDNICTKVRECVSEFGHEQLKPSYRETVLHEAYDDCTTENLLESIHEESDKSSKTEDFESKEMEDEITRSEIASAYLIESLMTDEACSNENVNKIEEPNLIEEKIKPRLPNFFTVVGDGNYSNNAGRQEEGIEKKITIRKNYKNDKRRKLLENLRDSLKLDVENADFHYLQTLIEKVTEQIDILGYQSMSENKSEIKKSYKSAKTKITAKDNDGGAPPKTLTLAENPKCPLQIPEVYHRPAVTNLHKRLLWQMEANDSFVTFQRLMRKHQKNKNAKIDSPISQINIPILTDTQSCCSQPRSNRGSQQSKRIYKKNVKEDVVKENLRFKYSDSLWFNGKKLYKLSKSQKDKKEKFKNLSKSKSRRRSTMNIGQKAPKSATSCGCSVTVRNNSPVVQNYCNTRLHGNPYKTNVQIPRRKLAYLDILDDLTNRDLLPLHSEYPRKDHLNTDIDQTWKDVHDSYLYKIMYGSKEKSRDIWNHLLQPTIECSDANCGFCNHPKHKMENQSSIKLPKEKRKSLSTDKATSVTARKKRIIKTLAPYMFDPQFERSLVVMPVRVFYDKDQSNSIDATLNSNNQKTIPPLPLIPIKEVKVNRARWINPNLKKTVKKIDSPKPVTDQVNTKAFVGNKSGVLSSKSEKVDSVKNFTTSYENKRFKLCYEEPKDLQDVYRKAKKNLDRLVVKHPSELEGRSKTNPIITRPKNEEFQQKMIHKSGKIIGKQVVSGQMEKSDSLSTSTPTTRHRQMLIHLKGLKQKNDRIQHNIQKAINVIESKMVDILSSSGNSASVDAFDAMEKEINNVLDLMKYQCNDKLPPVFEQARGDSNERDLPFNNSPHREKSVDNPLQANKKSNYVACEKVKREKITDSDRGKVKREKVADNDRKKSITNKRKLTEKRIQDSKFNNSEKLDIPKYPNCNKCQEFPSQDRLQLKNETTKVPNEVLENEFNVISADLFEKLENILYMDSHRDTSTSDIEDIHFTESKQKYSPRNKIDKIHSSSETTLSIDETCTKNKKYTSMGPIMNSKSQMFVNKDRFKRKNAKKDLPSMMVETTGFAAGEIVTNENICTNDQQEIYEYGEQHKETIDEIGDSINNFHVGALSVFMNMSSDSYLKPLNNKDGKKIAALDLDNFQSTSAPLTSTKPDCRNLSTKCNKIDTEPTEGSTEKFRRTKDDLKPNLNLPVQLKRPGTASDSSDVRKGVSERSTKSFPKESPKQSDFSDAGKNTLDLSNDPNDKIDADNNSDNLEDQVNKIISRVEDIYSQLDEIQISAKEHTGVPIFRDFSPRLEEIPSREFLTPFMQAVKHSRTVTKSLEPYHTNTLEKSPSYYNVLNFLDSLYDIHTEIAIEVHQTSEIHYSCIIEVPITFQFSKLEYCSNFINDNSCNDNICKELMEKPSCLKKHSGDVCKCMKPKRVSFLVMNQIEVPQNTVSTNRNENDEIENRLDHGDNFKTSNNIVIICDKRQTTDVSTEMNLTTESGTIETTDPVLVNSDVSTCGETTETTSDLSFVTAQSTPKIKVYYDEKQKDNLLEGFYNSKSIWEENGNNKPKVVIFREVDMSNIIKRPKNIQKFTNTDLVMTNNNFLIRRPLPDDNNVVLLNSFYAIVYLLMFTALNMEYKCF